MQIQSCIRDSESVNIQILPDVLLCNIVYFLTICDTVSLLFVCRTIYDGIQSTYCERVKYQYENTIRFFPMHIIGSLPMSVWLDLEWTEFQAHWMGSTDYIDGIDFNDIQGHPFKCCRDPYNRLAIVMRQKKNIVVLFQRYSDESHTWVFASKTLPIGGSRLSETMVARLVLWLCDDDANLQRD